MTKQEIEDLLRGAVRIAILCERAACAQIAKETADRYESNLDRSEGEDFRIFAFAVGVAGRIQTQIEARL